MANLFTRIAHMLACISEAAPQLPSVTLPPTLVLPESESVGTDLKNVGSNENAGNAEIPVAIVNSSERVIPKLESPDAQYLLGIISADIDAMLAKLAIYAYQVNLNTDSVSGNIQIQIAGMHVPIDRRYVN